MYKTDPTCFAATRRRSDPPRSSPDADRSSGRRLWGSGEVGVQKTELAALVAAEGRFPMKAAVADALEVARSHLREKFRRLAKPRGSYRKPDDGDLLPLIRRLVDERPTYGYRRITALANRELVKTGKPMANAKLRLA